MSKVAIVILNFNGRKHLEQFLPSVIHFSQSHRIIVADNASTDDSVDFLTKQYPQIELIILEQNFGFTGGYNRALKEVKAEYFCLLNSDVEVTPGWMDTLLNFMEIHPEVAALQPKILAYTQKTHFEYAGAGGGFIDKWGYPFCRGRLFHYTEEDTGQYDDCRQIFWASGACMLIRSEVYHELGGLDEEFFAHMEEIDLCWRILSSGRKVAYCGKSTVYHLGGGTLSRSNPRKTYLNFRNGLTILYKNLPNRKLSRILPLRIILDWVAAFKFLLADRSFADFKAVIKAHVDFWKNLGKYRKKRKQNRSLTSFNQSPEIYPKSIVYAFFIKGLRSFNELNHSKSSVTDC
jgi:GT2 family glycosyltransferase